MIAAVATLPVSSSSHWGGSIQLSPWSFSLRETVKIRRSGLAGGFNIRGWRGGFAVSVLRKLVRTPRVFKCLSRMLVSGLMLPFVVVGGGGEVSMRGKIVEFSSLPLRIFHGQYLRLGIVSTIHHKR
jgi:hypothetical protein